MNDIPSQLLLQFFLIMLNAFFAATEISLLSLSTAKLRKMAEDGDKSAPRLLKLASEPSGFLSTIQVGSRISVTVNGLHIQVEKIAERRIDYALVSKLEPCEEAPEE